MKIKKICLVYLILNVSLSFSQEIFLGGMTKSIKIWEDKIHIMAYFDENNQININEPYEIEKVKDFRILKTLNDEFLYFNSGRWLFLISDKYEPLFGNPINGGASNEGNGNLLFKKITASSYLTEKLNNKYLHYKAERLLDMDLLTGWVEGSENNGIHETLSLEMKKNWITKGIIIYNGFIDFNNPKLFYENSRAKKIKITVDSGDELIFILEDTPNEQIIRFPEGSNSFKLEIISVYEGSKYSDMSISGIFAEAETSRYIK